MTEAFRFFPLLSHILAYQLLLKPERKTGALDCVTVVSAVLGRSVQSCTAGMKKDKKRL